MKIYYNEFKGNNPAAKTSKTADVSYEVGNTHSSKRAYKALKMALDALKETADLQAVTITLVKEPKQSKHLESASASAGAFNQMLRHLNITKGENSMFRIHSESTAMYSQEFHTYEDAQRALPVISELWDANDLYIEECGHTKKITTQK